jgi:hypothetical protein
VPAGFPESLGRGFVEEEHAAVGERDLARTERVAAAEERGVRDRRVGCAEGAGGHERRAVEEPGDAMDGGDLDRLGERERRQDRREPPREHRLSGAGRAEQQHIVDDCQPVPYFISVSLAGAAFGRVSV